MGLENLPKAKWSAAGQQVILKNDFKDIELGFPQLLSLLNPPTLQWVDITAVKIGATADNPARVMMVGFPDVVNFGQFVAGLDESAYEPTDGEYYEVAADETMDFDVASCLWGSEKASQWYAIFAVAEDSGGGFVLKAMPIMRFSSQASKVITLRNNLNSADIGYGFTTDELVNGAIYILSGSSKGLLRGITANNNDNSTGGTVTYEGDTLTMAQGDWFVVLPPENFRFLGSIFNNASSQIVHFRKVGNKVQWLVAVDVGVWNGVGESILSACPLATELTVQRRLPTSDVIYLGHPDTPADATRVGIDFDAIIAGMATLTFAIENCRYYCDGNTGTVYAVGYAYPAGCGY